MPKKSRPSSKAVAKKIVSVLEDMKAIDIVEIDVKHLTTITDAMIVASGRSDRHVRAISDALVERCKAAGIEPLGVEGTEGGEWILIDLADAIVHVMLPRTRAFYEIEKLWDIARPRELAEKV